MAQIISLLVSLVFMAGAHSGHKAGGKVDAAATSFGGKFTAKEVLQLGDVISNYGDHESKTVAFEATANKVCEKKGCWMVLKDGQYEVRTLFKDYGFFVPANIVGKKVKVQGVMERKKVSAATIRHFMKDEGRKMQDIKKVKTGKIKFQFTADAVEII